MGQDAADTEDLLVGVYPRLAGSPRRHPALVETFNTHLISPQTLLALRTGREREAGEVMEAIVRNLKVVPGRLQHVAIYGPRGFGKSFLVRLIQIEVEQMAEEGAPVVYLLLPEEQPNLSRNPHSLLDYLAARLADRRRGDNGSWEQAAFKWPNPEQEAALWDAAAARLEEELDTTFADQDGQTRCGLAIAVVENFDTLLASVFKSPVDEQRLRRWLGHGHNRVMLLATGTGTADVDYDRPLFQAFQSLPLEPWTQDECIAYFNRRRALERRGPLDLAQEAKARAISDFIGGNPRLAQLLGDVLDTEDALSGAETMNALADRLADYYRRRIDDLTPLTRGLLDALIRGGEPCSATELAARVDAAQSDIARAMQDLKHADIIRAESVPRLRKKLYRVIDRVFVHFYRLRQGETVTRASPLLTILDFLRSFYSRDEMRAQAARYLDRGRFAEAGIFGRLSLEGTGFSIFRDEFRLRFPTYALADPGIMKMAVPGIVAQLEEAPERFEPESAVRGESALSGAIIAILQAQKLDRMGLYERAKAVFETSLANSQDDAAAMVMAAREFAYFLADDIDSEEMFRLVAAQPPDALPQSLAALALMSYASLRCDRPATAEEAIGPAERAIIKAAGSGDLYIQALAEQARSIALGKLDRWEEAVAAGDAAAATAREVGAPRLQADAALWTGFWLEVLRRDADALERAVQAFDLFSAFQSARLVSDAARLAIDCAAHVPCARAVAIYEHWIEQHAAAAEQTMLEPAVWFDGLLAAVTRADLWFEFDTFSARRGEWISAHVRSVGGGYSMGTAVAATFAADGRARAFAAARALFARLTILSEDVPSLRTSQSSDASWLRGFASGFAGECRDHGLIRDIARVIGDVLAPDASTVPQLLYSLADFDEAGDRRSLARLDPDVVTWIARIRNIEINPPPPSETKPIRQPHR
jgi:hypothetical protein